MLIAIILTVWILGAAVLCMGLCSAAACPIPLPDATAKCDRATNSDTPMQRPRMCELRPVFWLAIALAIITTSCVAIPPGSHPVNIGRSEPVKGAMLLMDHSR